MPAARNLKRVQAFFFTSQGGREPVKEWLMDLPRVDRRELGRGLMTLEFGWPVGMPLTRPMGQGLHELRIDLAGNRAARVFFMSIFNSIYYCCMLL